MEKCFVTCTGKQILGVLAWTLNCIWRWDSSSGALESVKLPHYSHIHSNLKRSYMSGSKRSVWKLLVFDRNTWKYTAMWKEIIIISILATNFYRLFSSLRGCQSLLVFKTFISILASLSNTTSIDCYYHSTPYMFFNQALALPSWLGW